MSWLFLAAVGFIVGQILSLVILTIIAAANGHLSNLSTLAAETVPPAWVVVGGLAGLWMGFLGAVVLASRTKGTGNVVADMGLRLRPWDPVIGGLMGWPASSSSSPSSTSPGSRPIPISPTSSRPRPST